MINCIIIEDEPLSTKKLLNFIAKVPYLNLLESFNSALSAMDFLNQNSVELIFLDIEMKGLNGIEFLKSTNIKSKIIITTAYKQYAIEGFDMQVCDYLLKPISFERFVRATDKVSKELITEKQSNKIDKIFIKTEYRLEGINISDIQYIEGVGDYRRIVCKDNKIMSLHTFGKLYELLPKDNFLRVHNSYIISIDKIEKIERNRIYINDKIIPIGNKYSKQFYDKIKRL